MCVSMCANLLACLLADTYHKPKLIFTQETNLAKYTSFTEHMELKCKMVVLTVGPSL